MSAELAWYMGCPLVAAALGVAAVRSTRATKAALPPGPADEEEEAPLQLVGSARAATAARPTQPANEEAVAGTPVRPAVPQAVWGRASTRSNPGMAARLLRRGAGMVIRRHAHQPAAPRSDGLAADHAAGAVVTDGISDVAPAVGEHGAAPTLGGCADAAAPEAIAPPNLTEAEPLGWETAFGHGIIEFEHDPGDERAIGGPEWSAAVTQRETALAAALDARETAQRLERQRQDEAAALHHQHELERIAVAEQARVRAQARAARWFVRLDGDLDAPTVPQRSTLATTLGIRAPWAGKLLREAFVQEVEPTVRARILGALVTGDHLDVAEPFETGFARGGIERAAVWETLRPRRDRAEWIAALLADAMEAA